MLHNLLLIWWWDLFYLSAVHTVVMHICLSKARDPVEVELLEDILQRVMSCARVCRAFYQVFPIWVKKVCLHGWTLRGLLVPTHSLLHHPWLSCSSTHFIDATLSPRDQCCCWFIFPSKQYGYNGFTTPLALGRWSWFVGRSNNTNSTFTAVNCFCICTRGFLQFEGLFMDSCSILTIFF